MRKFPSFVFIYLYSLLFALFAYKSKQKQQRNVKRGVGGEWEMGIDNPTTI